MPILKSCVSPVRRIKIFYKWNEALYTMSPDDFETPNNEIDNESAETVYIQNICLDHLKSHKIKSHPEKAEFLMLFGGLLES